ncbi:MAG: ABC transporter ATP-binding protein [Pseudobutyrivibrio sp.]|nr:ABC transporter ATP-binding protein [Pseudobutyrivibrio sp.]
MSILKINNMTKSYGENKVVNGLSVNVNKGEIFGLLGPNGAGKSTTINCIMGLIGFDDGTIEFEDGQSINKWQKNIGYVPQNISIYMDLTARENVSFFCSLYGFKGDDLQKRVDFALEFVGLTEAADKRAKEFSGGMQRRLNIACAITHSPKLIIMDEPTAGVDPQSRNHILDSVKKLNEKGITIIYTSHYMEEVEYLCDRICIMDHGRVVTQGSKDEIKKTVGDDVVIEVNISKELENDTKLKEAITKISEVKSYEKISSYTFNITADKNDFIIADVVKIFSTQGYDITSIDTHAPTLESLFLLVTGKELRD